MTRVDSVPHPAPDAVENADGSVRYEVRVLAACLQLLRMRPLCTATLQLRLRALKLVRRTISSRDHDK
eukprot:CAMPEP_0185836522 /NCGR_PEP_ID=MMETSP1353-20130828/9902_1 /TAXON_ID=1077150 /ORGANISM="Erythrolobus australicus, Strain CCMP3124" /LENGTH=67 /DNA_ID=CAMNT_0028535327 /DNA_START=327 /DNA_END=530 /DNA_ORIENTATION=-